MVFVSKIMQDFIISSSTLDLQVGGGSVEVQQQCRLHPARSVAGDQVKQSLGKIEYFKKCIAH